MMNDEFLFFFFTSSVSSKSRDAVGWFRFVYSVSPNSGSRLGFFFSLSQKIRQMLQRAKCECGCGGGFLSVCF